MRQLKQFIDTLSDQVAGLCLNDTLNLDSMLATLQKIEQISLELNNAGTINTVTTAYKAYVQRMASGDVTNTTPLEQGLTLYHALVRHCEKKLDFPFDISDVLQNLDFTEPSQLSNDDSAGQRRSSQISSSDPSAPHDLSPGQNEASGRLTDDDIEILTDFVSEAEDNLETIEVELIELEQDPGNTDIINNIFRPFHTIKGVSGFLDLKKINRLSHSTENLLDVARSGDLEIDGRIADAILESVDLLKHLLGTVSQGIATQQHISDDAINIEPLREKLKTLQRAGKTPNQKPVGEILIQKGVIDDETLEDALTLQNSVPEKRIGEILVEKNKASGPDIAAALMEQKSFKKITPTQVKVNTTKLDDLVDYAGELVIAQSMLKQQALKTPALHQSINQLEQIVSNIQRIAMSMRMIPIQFTFVKMIRLVRDLARRSNKKVSLKMSGEETEIDRNVVDALYEPMVHMIRNAVDHGIETQDERRRLKKPTQGTIYLKAYHKGGSIVIEIEDDGRGLDKERILAKAIEKGIVRADEALTDAQIYALILAPGFSTATAITDISGRGVGMDVVKDGIEHFRGDLGITANPGKGTRFTISLPLTLAIIDGMLVRIGRERYVIPTIAIQRSFRPDVKECFTVKGKGEMIRERNALLPLIRMKSICEVNNDVDQPWQGLVVVVESKDETRCLLVDELLGKDEYVIKSLGGNLEHVTGFSGGAILADGKVGLILDIHGIFELASAQ